MGKNTANVTGARNYAEMSSSRRQSRGQMTDAKIRSYQNWIATRPAEYWDETVERRAYNALVFNKDCRKNAAIVAAIMQRPVVDAMLERMVFALIDMQCDIEGLSHKWEFPVVADATAALLAQLKRTGGQKAAWAHKQNPAAIARKVFRSYETIFVKCR